MPKIYDMEETKETKEIKETRIIVWLPYTGATIHSYGAIIWCRQSQEVLLVRQRYTYALMTIASGRYRESSLRDLLSECTPEEIELLKQRPRLVCNDYAMSRFYLVLKYINDAIPRGVLKWGFPKGRKMPNETEMDAARREVLEETCLSFDSGIYPHPLIEKNRDHSRGIEYVCKYWPIVVDEKMPVEETSTYFEISARKWVSREEARKLLDETKFKLLDNVRFLAAQRLV